VGRTSGAFSGHGRDRARGLRMGVDPLGRGRAHMAELFRRGKVHRPDLTVVNEDVESHLSFHESDGGRGRFGPWTPLTYFALQGRLIIGSTWTDFDIAFACRYRPARQRQSSRAAAV